MMELPFESEIASAIIALLIVLAPSAFLRVQFGGWLHNLAALFGPFLQAYVAVALFVPLPVWLCWNVGLSISGGQFNPLWGVFPALLAEMHYSPMGS